MESKLFLASDWDCGCSWSKLIEDCLEKMNEFMVGKDIKIYTLDIHRAEYPEGKYKGSRYVELTLFYEVISVG